MIPYPSIKIANWFIYKSIKTGKYLNTLYLIRLVYIAHGWHLSVLNNPLLSEDVQAWNFGPVIPELYHAMKKFGNDKIKEPLYFIDRNDINKSSILDNDYLRNSLLEKIWEVYVVDSNEDEIRSISCHHDSPWNKRWIEMQEIRMTQSKIDNVKIKNYFDIIKNKNSTNTKTDGLSIHFNNDEIIEASIFIDEVEIEYIDGDEIEAAFNKLIYNSGGIRR